MAAVGARWAAAMCLQPTATAPMRLAVASRPATAASTHAHRARSRWFPLGPALPVGALRAVRLLQMQAAAFSPQASLALAITSTGVCLRLLAAAPTTAPMHLAVASWAAMVASHARALHTGSRWYPPGPIPPAPQAPLAAKTRRCGHSPSLLAARGLTGRGLQARAQAGVDHRLHPRRNCRRSAAHRPSQQTTGSPRLPAP